MGKKILCLFLMFFMNATFLLDAQESSDRTFVGTTVDGKTLTFIIVDEEARKVAVGTGEKLVSAVQKSVQGCIIIPDEVNGYKVIQIGAYAFTGCQMDSVIIPEGVETIEQGAFESCENLTYVSIPSTVKKIGQYALCAGENLTTIISRIQDPRNTTMEDSVFDEWIAVDSKQRRMWDYGLTWMLGTYEKATLYVPQGTKELYQSAYEWQNFSNIVEMVTNGIPSVQSVKNKVVGCCDLTGRPLRSRPSRGIYIQKGKKVLVR